MISDGLPCSTETNLYGINAIFSPKKNLSFDVLSMILLTDEFLLVVFETSGFRLLIVRLYKETSFHHPEPYSYHFTIIE